MRQQDGSSQQERSEAPDEQGTPEGLHRHDASSQHDVPDQLMEPGRSDGEPAARQHDGTLEEADSRAENVPSEDATVVGIGASAGGLNALRAFFRHMPADSGLIFVVVVHLSPDHESHLADILQRFSEMPVAQVSDITPLVSDHVYVIPPGRNLSTIDTHLRLSDIEEQRRERAPIDHFFRTLSETHGGKAVGIILTGTGSDGTLGLKEIKQHGGLTIAQDPAEAEYDGMPQSAIATGLVDLVLPIERMPGRILEFARTEPQVPIPEDGADLATENFHVLQRIFAQIRARTGHDFSRYKQSTIMRRIRRRMQLHHKEYLADYLELLRENRDEVSGLFDDLLITVTSFFRDEEVFEILETDIIPKIFEEKGPGDRVRVWSVGCATGEEVYSLAILLREHSGRVEHPPEIQVFASDPHEHSLKKARDGLFPENIESDVSPERLQRHFVRENGRYRVRKEVREMIVFASHNLIKDPPFSQLDLVTCRNVMIYLEQDVQRNILQLFHYGLKPSGHLVLGTSETADRSELFEVVDARHRIYRRRNIHTSEPRLPSFPFPAYHRSIGEQTVDSGKSPNSYGELHQRIVEQFAPPSILVDKDGNIVHYSAHAGRYMQHPGGEPSNNVFKNVREELRIELRAALRAAGEAKKGAQSKPIRTRIEGETRLVTLRVRKAEDDGMGFLLIMFDEDEETDTDSALGDGQSDVSVRQPEEELLLTRKRLQSMIDEYENGQEEARGTVEELQSTNEELRSTMEELETSKEELQSMNEELATVNQENRHKVEELRQLSSDLQNLLTATEIATLFLDRELRIMRYTPRVGELFNIRHSDRGRPLTDLTHHLGDHALHEDARSVLESFISVEREMKSEDGRWYLVRVLPYRTAEDRVDGVVLTFVDITALKSAAEELRKSEERYRLLMENVREYAIIMLDADGRIATWNMGAERLFGYREEEIIGRTIEEVYSEVDQRRGAARKAIEEAARKGHAVDERWHMRRDGTKFWASGVMTALYEADGSLRGFTKILRDESERKSAEAARIHFQALFESAPGLYIVLEPEQYQIVAVSNVFVNSTNTQRDEITGRFFFEVFPDDPDNPEASGVEQLRDSFERVKADGRADVLGVLRYPIPRPPHDGGGFEERFWSTINSPVFGPDGNLAYIIHRAEDVTPFINQMREEKREAEAHRLLESRAEQMEADILLRARELQEANQQLRRFNETLEDRVRERTQQVRRLASQLTMAEQAERRRISQILHDNLQQLLYALQMKVNYLSNKITSGEAEELRKHAEQARSWISQAVSTTRQITVDLSPPVLQGEGLEDALLWLVRQMEDLHGLKVEVIAHGDLRMPDDDMRVLLFQIVRELLFNVVKHADVDRATVDLSEQEEFLVISVADQGTGFDPTTLEAIPKRIGGHGLHNIRERLELFGGDVDVTSVEGQGTQISVTIPVNR